MPPADAGQPLTEHEVTLLRRWISAGAPYEKHWAYQPPVAATPPSVEQSQWPANPIDQFILARLESEGLTTSERADRYTLLRRVSLDLRGLPPTPAEVERFVNDDSPLAYERTVDRLLADTAYGERWARLWLDLARYADSKGYGSDPLREIWPYRDWVISALNANIPYDQFTIEQIAGDLLPEGDLHSKIATAFHRNTMTNTEGGTDDEEFRVAAVRDRVDTTFQVWMGTTMGCAKCHNHKYDPISQAEYYQFYDYFNHSADADRPDESPVLSIPDESVVAARESIDRQIQALRAQREQAAEADQAGIDKQIETLEKSKPALPTVPVMQELPPDQHRDTFIMVKGSFLSPGDPVERGTPKIFHPLPSGAPQNRLGVAEWLVDEQNPLTARVMVNRLWAQLFGTGLVVSEEDFGTQGELPSHPELLDWLALEFMHSGWDIKALLRLMVTSETYCQASTVTPDDLRTDPENRWVGRASRFRLEAEIVRDQALAVSGLLSRKMNGPSVYPPQPEGLWRAAFNGRDRSWETSQGVDRYRRGLYTFWRRTIPYPSMATFDAPSRETCSVRRIRTNTPLQAFVTMNDPVFVEAAQALARRIVAEGGDDDRSRLEYAIMLCLSRPARDSEIDKLTALLSSERDFYTDKPKDARLLATDPLGPLASDADAANLAAWTVIANVLLNLDSILMRG